MKRQFDPAESELMDRPQPISRELEDDLRNIRALNSYFGSYRVVLRFVRRWIKPGDHVRIVDLATGSGDIPRLVVNHARSIGAMVKIDAVDRQSATLDIAKRLSENYPEISFIPADILEWHPAARYDVVLCSLVLHHFTEDDAVGVLRRCRELSKRFVLVSDLRRGLLASVGVYLLTTLVFRNPMTRHDARASAARAFSFQEFRSLAERAGWRNFGHKKFRFARQAIWLEKIDN